MRTARIPLLALPLSAVVLLAAFQAPPQPPDTGVVIRVAKHQAVLVPPALAGQLVALEELETAWIASAPAETVRRLEALGAVVEELPAPPAGHAYFVVFDPSPADREQLRGRGTVFEGDESSCLFLAPDDLARELVPPRLTFKRVGGPLAGPPWFTTGATSVAPAGPSTARDAAVGPLAADLAARVATDRLRSAIADLQGFGTRYASTPACEAAGSYILEEFMRFGLEAVADEFVVGTATPFTTRNIVATLPGRVDPSRVVIVSAHYDSFSELRDTLAPGADDNASGTAAVIEAARLLAGHAFDFTVRFIAFGAEERGLLGSQRYAQAARARGEQIVGVVNLDMIAWADRLPEDLDLVGSPTSGWLADRVAAAAAAVAALPAVTQTRTSYGSDCSPFWQQGFAAVCGIEDTQPTNPYYHKSTDRLETLDLDLATGITRAVVASVVDLAQPLGAVSPPTGLGARSQTTASLFMRSTTVWLDWEGYGPGVAGYNVYRASTSHGSYRRVNASPVRAVSYAERVDPLADFFYVVTAVDGSGRESNYSGEVRVPRAMSSQSR